MPPWSKPIDDLAPEELNTPDPTSFPDDILLYLSTTIVEARLLYKTDLDTHVTDGIRLACPHTMDLQTSKLAYDVFVLSSWNWHHKKYLSMSILNLTYLIISQLKSTLSAKHSAKTPRQNLTEWNPIFMNIPTQQSHHYWSSSPKLLNIHPPLWGLPAIKESPEINPTRTSVNY